MVNYGTPPLSFRAKLSTLMISHGHRVFNVRQKPPGGVYVGKGSIYANPWRGSTTIESRIQNIWNFYNYLKDELHAIDGKITYEDIAELEGKDLVCFCNDGSNIPDEHKFCHSLILLECERLTHNTP